MTMKAAAAVVLQKTPTLQLEMKDTFRDYT